MSDPDQVAVSWVPVPIMRLVPASLALVSPYHAEELPSRAEEEQRLASVASLKQGRTAPRVRVP